MMIYAGIDPGISSGALALYDGSLKIHPWTTASDMAFILYDIIEDHDIFAVIEQVTRPRALVENAGIWKGLLTALGIPFKEVTPQKWQKYFGRFPQDKRQRKQRLLEIAQQRFPGVRGLDIETADAVLLEEYAREVAWKDAE